MHIFQHFNGSTHQSVNEGLFDFADASGHLEYPGHDRVQFGLVLAHFSFGYIHLSNFFIYLAAKHNGLCPSQNDGHGGQRAEPKMVFNTTVPAAMPPPPDAKVPPPNHARVAFWAAMPDRLPIAVPVEAVAKAPTAVYTPAAVTAPAASPPAALPPMLTARSTMLASIFCFSSSNSSTVIPDSSSKRRSLTFALTKKSAASRSVSMAASRCPLRSSTLEFTSSTNLRYDSC